MSSGEIVGIVVAVCTLMAALIPAILNYRKAQTIKSSKDADKLPKPFACSSLFYEDICSVTYTERNGYKFHYSFERFSSDERNVGFVSLVYKFPMPISLAKCKSLSFQLLFGDFDNFKRVDLEIKSENVMNVFPFQHGSGDPNHTINILNEIDKEIRKKVTQICFVVKPDYHIQDKPWNGEFIVNNLKINTK